jgi:LysM repeat protein
MDKSFPHMKVIFLRLFWSLALGVWAWDSLQAEGTTYTVRKHDTLSIIAHEHGMSVNLLARYNGLNDPDRIYAGQHLVIPDAAALRRGPILEADLKTGLNATHVKPGTWKYIVIHHSATDVGTLKGIDRYHREIGMENGLAYHFVIGNGRGIQDGKIAVGQRWTKQLQGGHLSSLALNEKSLGICLIGNFEHDRPTAKQMESLKALLLYLMDRCDLSTGAIQTHQEINTLHTRCPGRHFPEAEFKKAMRDLE